MATVTFDRAEQRFIDRVQRTTPGQLRVASWGFAIATVGTLLIGVVELWAAVRGERPDWPKTIGFLLVLWGFLFTQWQAARERQVASRVFRKLA